MLKTLLLTVLVIMLCAGAAGAAAPVTCGQLVAAVADNDQVSLESYSQSIINYLAQFYPSVLKNPEQRDYVALNTGRLCGLDENAEDGDMPMLSIVQMLAIQATGFN